MKKLVLTLALAFAATAFGARAAEPFKGKILLVDFKEQVAERGGSGMSVSLGGISNKRTVNLLSVERAIDAAAKDSRIAMIFLKTDNYSGGPAQAEELRSAIERFRAAGKPVIAYNTSYGNGSYYLASVADKVVLNASGEGSLSGMSSTMLFYKDLIDALGIKVQLIRHGKYKSAGEPYIRNDISEANREQYARMLGSIWETFKGDIAASRELAPEAIDALVDGLALSEADTWLKAGLVDKVFTKTEMEKYLCGQFGVKEVENLKVINISDYISKSVKKGPSANKIAVVYADGSIGSGSDVDGVKLAQTIADVRADETVKAVVWRVNSPGGAVLDSDLIRKEIDELRKVKPVIASYGNYAASGGYWISSGSDRIFTDKTTLTGSIGVFGLVPVLGEAIRKNLKVNPVTIGTHEHSDMMGGMREFSPEEEAWMQDHIDTIYNKFVSLVAESRGLTREAVDDIAQGRVWTGADALGIGLADQTGTCLDAIEYAADRAGLKNYGIVYYPEIKSVSLRSMLSGKGKDEEPLVELKLPAAVAPAADAVQKAASLVGDLDRPSIQARMPYLVELK